MARTKRDQMKRRMAQACAHIANAILDINDVYKEFADAAEAQKTARVDADVEAVHADTSAHEKYADMLKLVMLALSVDRDAALAFVLSAWGLDENQLNVFV
jgi:hypothetical protein